MDTGQLSNQGDVFPEGVEGRPGGLRKISTIERIGVVQKLHPIHHRCGSHRAAIQKNRHIAVETEAPKHKVENNSDFCVHHQANENDPLFSQNTHTKLYPSNRAGGRNLCACLFPLLRRSGANRAEGERKKEQYARNPGVLQRAIISRP